MAAQPKATRLDDLAEIDKLWTDFKSGSHLRCPVEPSGSIALSVQEGEIVAYRLHCTFCSWESMTFVASEDGIKSFGSLATMPPRPRRRAF